MDSDTAIASQKLQTDLLAIQNWFKKRKMKANESKSIHVAFTTQRETCPPVHINSVQLPQEEDIKYLGLHLDRRLTRHRHESPSINVLATRTKVRTLYKLLIYKTILKPILTYRIQL
jgi:hypothetical protein